MRSEWADLISFRRDARLARCGGGRRRRIIIIIMIVVVVVPFALRFRSAHLATA